MTTPGKNTLPYRRICVVGTTGSGKTTFAAALAARLHVPHIELDALHWDPGWQEVPDEVFRQRVEMAARQPAWVCDGNYHVVRDLLWARAEAVIWLDYPLGVIFARLLYRTLRRAITREVLWNGNREPFWPHLKLWSPESLIHWMFKSYGRRKREYPQLFAQPEYAHLHVIRFAAPRQAAAWLAGKTRSEATNMLKSLL